MRRIIPIVNSDYALVFRYLCEQDPWHVIALDALQEYGMNHPQHRWFAEYDSGRICGVIYQHGHLLHLAYKQAPSQYSPLFLFIQENCPEFITHGPKRIVQPLMTRLKGYHIKLDDECDFVVQTSQTKRVLKAFTPSRPLFTIRLAKATDFQALSSLFRGSEIEHQVDFALIAHLIRKQRIIIAEKKDQLIGSIMILKESPAYSLLGGLFVRPRERKQGHAIRLGQAMLQQTLKRGKKVCFYYSDRKLERVYRQAGFIKIGKWVSYSGLQTSTTSI